MTNLIYSRRADDAVLSLSEIARKAPAAFAETPIETASERYGHINTASAIEILKDYGWHPVQAAQKTGRTIQRHLHAEHLIAFARGSDERYFSDAGRPEIILYNSSDKTSSLRLFAGWYRFICSNGLHAGEGFSAKVYHTKSGANGFEGMLINIAAQMPEMIERIDRMQSRKMMLPEIDVIAGEAAKIRWKPISDRTEGENGSFADDRTMRSLLHRRRYADAVASEGVSLWEIFNRVQEGVIRGGAVLQSYSKASPYGTTRKARPLGSVRQIVDANRKLWDLADAMV